MMGLAVGQMQGLSYTALELVLGHTESGQVLGHTESGQVLGHIVLVAVHTE